MASRKPLLDARTVGIHKAAWLLEDASFQKSHKVYPEDTVGAREANFKVLRAEKFYNKALLCLILLTIVEVPTWCRTDTHFWSFMDPVERCPSPTVDKSTGEHYEMYLSGIWYIPPGIGCAIELVCIAVIMRKFM